MKKSIFSIILLFFTISIFSVIFVLYNYGPLKARDELTMLTSKSEPECINNQECVPEKRLVGVNYLCEKGRCMTKVLANPASTNCQEKGGGVEMRKNNNGEVYGVCLFSDGTECEEWKFLREECAVGEFSPNDNVWKGSVKAFRGNIRDKYFEALNGDEFLISSDNENIQDILNALVNKTNKIKIRGIIKDIDEAVNDKELIVMEIIDLGDVLFKEVNLEESLEITSREIEAGDDFINKRGRNLELFDIIKINCPYCWNFIFTYLDGKRKLIFLDVIIQEGEVKDVVEIDGSIYKKL